MSKLIINGVDGNFGYYVASHIEKLVKKEDLILTVPFEKAREPWLE